MYGARISDCDNWFEMWFEDKKSIISTMLKNLTDDLNAGYDYFGKSIQDQKEQITSYEKKFNEELDMFKTMEDKQVNRWCFYDLKKRGAIE